MNVRIVVTADNHLNRYVARMPAARLDERRTRLRQAFRQVVDGAVAERADLVVLAGTRLMRLTRATSSARHSRTFSPNCVMLVSLLLPSAVTTIHLARQPITVATRRLTSLPRQDFSTISANRADQVNWNMSCSTSVGNAS